MNKRNAKDQVDTGDLDRWVGIPLGGSNMLDPLHVNDIRRWAQGMQNPNPLYYDRNYAKESRFGQIIAPQSFVVATSDGGGGLAPATQGRIEGTHALLVGNEWWFYGPQIVPGDMIRQERMLYDYQIKETKFAGAAIMTRGDTIYINQRGEVVAKQRATVMRYRAEEAVKRSLYRDEEDPEWTQEEIHKIEQQRFDWIKSFRSLGHGRRTSTKVGEKLLTRPLGPHSMMSVVTEWRSVPATVWGAFGDDRFRHASTEGSDWSGEAGWLTELSRSPGEAEIDPGYGGDLYRGPSLANISPRLGHLVGMPRRFGFGVSMGAWMLDYLGNWAGEWGEILHSNISLRYPVFTGDVAFIDGEVIAIDQPDSYGSIATVGLTMKNQNDRQMAKGIVELRLATEP